MCYCLLHCFPFNSSTEVKSRAELYIYYTEELEGMDSFHLIVGFL